MDTRQIATELYHYLEDTANKNDIILAVAQMENNYQSPINSWVYGLFYQYCRIRSADINLLKSDLLVKESSLNAIIYFFQSGAWTATSANTQLMASLLKKLPHHTVHSTEFSQLNQNLLEYAEQYQQNNLLTILKMQFNNSKVKEHCLNKFSKLFSRGLLTRAFDDFPFLLLSEEETDKLNIEFRIIISTISVPVDIEMQILTTQHQQAINQWLQQIVEIAVNNLINLKGEIKTAILTLLTCEPCLTPQQTIGMVCAYVGRVVSDITHDQFLHPAYVIFCNHINKNYGHLITAALNAKNNQIQQRHGMTLTWPIMGLGTGVLLTVATLGFLFFKKQNDKSIPTIEIKEINNSPSSSYLQPREM